MNPSVVPCRLFGFMAHNGESCVLLRRGPTAWVQLIKWHLPSGVFDRGQWFRGRIYEFNSDVSPDGELFAYSARKEGPRQAKTSYSETFVAVSRPPYFTALTLWPFGGGDGNSAAIFVE